MTYESANTGPPAVDGALSLIRGINDSDIDALYELDQTVFGRLAYPYFALRQLLDLHRRYCLVVDDDDSLVGYSLGAMASGPRIGWLLGLGVLPRARRCGHGRALVQQTVDRLRADGAESMVLTVEPENTAAIRVYEAQGFRIAGYDPVYFGPRDGRLVMWLDFGTPRVRASGDRLEAWWT
jgi:[ribosomal protein S18]-alanine N-acetyltransferase